MMAWWALGVAAAIAAIAIHYIHRGARQQLIVANPQLYADVARPRLVLHQLTEQWLLLLRLALLALAFWMTFGAAQQAPESQRTFASLAVVPGAPASSWTAMVRSGQSAVWLDRDLTPITQPSVSGFDASALHTLDAMLPAEIPLTVIGALPARHWPRRGFAMTRPVRWIDAVGVASDTDVSVVTPPNIVIAIEDAAARAVLIAVSDIWRNAGIVSEVRWTPPEGASFPNTEEWILWVAPVQDVPPLPAHAVIASTAPEVVTRDSERFTPTEHATVLWQLLGRLPSEVPAPNATVAGSPFVEIAAVAQRSQLRPPGIVGSWWLIGFAGLFCLERAVAQRRGRQAQ